MKRLFQMAISGALIPAALSSSALAATPLDEAITQAAKVPGYRPQIRAIYEVLAARPIEDFPAAMDRIDELQITSPLLSDTLGYWIERDVASAQAWLDAHPDKRFYGPPFCAAWVRVDLAGLVNWLNSSERAREYAIDARGELFQAFAREDPATAAEWSLRMPKPASINHIYDEQKFFLEWAGHDPVAAGTRALAIPAGAVRLNALRGVMSGWSANDREAAARWANAIEDPALRRECTASLEFHDKIRQEHGIETATPPRSAAPAKLPPAPEMAAALNHPSEMHVQHDYFVQAERLGLEARVLALEAVWQHQRERRVFKVFFTACSGWAEKDFAGFRAHVEAMSDPETGAIARMALMKRWQRTDESAALAWANQLPPAQRDSLLRSAKLFTPQPADPNQRLAKVLAEPGHFGEASTILADWAKQNPEAAAARALAFAKEGERSMAVAGVLRGWVEKDPAAALAWVRKLDAANRVDACGRLFEAWARRDLDTALTTAQMLGDDLRPAALGSIVPLMLERDHDRALVLLATIPLHYAGQGYLSWGDRDPAAAVAGLMRRAATEPVLDQRVVYVEMIVRSWAKRDLPAAAAFVMAQSGPVRDRICSEIVEVWKKSAPQAAVEWILTLPDFDAPMRRSALERAIGGWVDSGQQEAIAWVDGLTKDPKRDAAVAALARAIMPHDADAALARLRTIRDPKQQREALYAAWIQWSAVDGKGAAVRWLHSASLSPAERQLLFRGR